MFDFNSGVVLPPRERDKFQYICRVQIVLMPPKTATDVDLPFDCIASETHDCLSFQSSLRSRAHGTLCILA
jgi:hypothetical protein